MIILHLILQHWSLSVICDNTTLDFLFIFLNGTKYVLFVLYNIDLAGNEFFLTIQMGFLIDMLLIFWA